MSATYLALIFAVLQCGRGELLSSGPPRVENRPLLLNSYIPAGMQVIAYLTDLLKYDLRPSGNPTTTTPKTPPTPSHGPAIYAPPHPPGAQAYYSRGTTYDQYVERLKNPLGISYFDRYKYPFEYLGRSLQKREEKTGKALEWVGESLPEDLDLLGIGPSDLLKKVNKLYEDYDFVDDDEQVLEFSRSYDDSDFKNYLVKHKKVPPTKAYVTLLSLYDMLNKEAKKLNLNKYGGYSQSVVRVLVDTSSGTASAQLKTVLQKIVERMDTKQEALLTKIKALVADLNQADSYLNDALRYLPPLQFEL